MPLLTDSDGKILPFVISDFSGGMRMDVDASKLESNEYFLLINGRSRDGKLRPVKLPQQETTVSGTKFQAVFGTGSTILVIIDGYIFARDYEGVSGSFIIPAFERMSAAVDTIYGEFIPASNINFQRTIPPGEGDFNPQTTPLLFRDGLQNSPRALILQDGENQPRLMFPDGMSSRTTKNFAQWDYANDREYVPKGKQMLYHDGKLYIVSPDGSEMFHSVTGRPLDFVIAIQGEEGNKIVDGLYAEEASRLSHKIAYEPITSLARLDISMENSELAPPFYVGTKHSSFMIYPDLVNTIYDEPTFKNVGLFPTGPLNHHAFIEMDGDFGFISNTGIRSFNAIGQVKNEGKNSLFSLYVHPLFVHPSTGEYLSQEGTACWNFDNYSLFAVNTIYGQGILVYDNLIRKHVALDIYPGIGQIKQFAEIIANGRHRLFFITSTGLYEAFAGGIATMRCLPREWSTNNLNVEHRLFKSRVIIDSITTAGSLTVTGYSDRRKGETKTRNLTVNTEPVVLPLTPPYGNATLDTEREETFKFSESKRGYKIGMELAMNAMADIVEVQVLPEVFVEEVAEEQRART